MLATPESPPMNRSMVMREAQCIVHRLEALATTPLVDTHQITLVDFTLSSPELNMTGTPCRKLFHEETPKENDTLPESELILAEEQLGALSLSTSTPLQLSPSAPVFGASFTIGAVDATGLEPCKDLPPCALPCPAGTECKVASPKAFHHKVLLSDPEDAPSSPCLVTLDEALELRGAGGGLVEVLAGSAPHQSPSLAAGETGLRASDRATDGPCHLVSVAGSDDGNPISTPPEPLPALGESFIVTREFPTADTGALDGSPVPETTFAIPDILPVETAVTQAPLAKMDATMIREDLLEQPSSESAALAFRNVPCTPPEPLPAQGASFVVATESQAANTVALHGSPVAIGVAETTFAIPDISPVETAAKQAPSAKMGAAMNSKAGGLLRQPSTKSAALASRSVSSPRPAPLQRPAARLSVATKPRAVPVRPSAANRAVADTTFATSMRPPSRPPVVSKAVEQPKPGSATAVSKPARKGATPPAPAMPQRPPVRTTAAVPERRRTLVPPAGASTASRSLQPAKGAIGGAARVPASRLSTVPESAAQRTFLHGARRSVAAIPKAMAAVSQPAPAEPPKAKTGLHAASTVQPSHLPSRSRLKPPATRASGSTSRVPRLPAFREASCLPQVPESPVATRLSSTPARPNVPLGSGSPALTPIRKQPDWR